MKAARLRDGPDPFSAAQGPLNRVNRANPTLSALKTRLSQSDGDDGLTRQE